MKNHLTKSIGLMAFMLVVASCVADKKEKAVVNIFSKTQQSSEVKFFHGNHLEETVLALSKTDSLGHCSFEVDLQRPVLATIMIGEKYGEVYLVPEGNLTINENGKAYTTPLTFSGDGKTINNCLSWFNSAFERIRWGRVHPPALNQDEYVKRLDSLKAIFTDFKEQCQDSITLSDGEWALLETKSKMKVLEFEQEYHFYKYNDLVREKFAAIRSGKPFEDQITAKEFQRQPHDIPFDSSYLSYSDYQTLLNFYWQNKVHLPSAEIVGPNGQTQRAPLLSDSLIKRSNYPKGIDEYLIAFNVNYWLSVSGITYETDSIVSDFKRTYATSKYWPAINNTYQEWLAVAPGSPAPNIEGTTAEGKRISLHDLRGKLVYVDVWATWCGPCVEEIPFSKKVQEEFSKEKDIQFLNVSMDQNKPAWEKFIANDKAWKGLHIIIDSEKINAFYKNYKVAGIPAFFLIDKSGNIIYTKAPRPSDKKLVEIIKKFM